MNTYKHWAFTEKCNSVNTVKTGKFSYKNILSQIMHFVGLWEPHSCEARECSLEGGRHATQEVVCCGEAVQMTSVARVAAQDGVSVVWAKAAGQGGPAASENHAQSVSHHSPPLQHSGGVRAERYVLQNQSVAPDGRLFPPTKFKAGVWN